MQHDSDPNLKNTADQENLLHLKPIGYCGMTSRTRHPNMAELECLFKTEGSIIPPRARAATESALGNHQTTKRGSANGSHLLFSTTTEDDERELFAHSNLARVSNNDTSICTSDHCEPEAQAQTARNTQLQTACSAFSSL